MKGEGCRVMSWSMSSGMDERQQRGRLHGSKQAA
jgi:hypothetical protein